MINLGDVVLNFIPEDSELAGAFQRNEQGAINWANTVGTIAKGAMIGIGVAVGAAVVDVGRQVVDLAGQASQATNDLQASLGVTSEEAARLGDTAVEIFGNNWGNSLEDVTQSLILVKQGMASINDPAELQNATEAAIALRDSFGEDMNESIAAANALMQQFGLDSTQAFDFLASASQRGINITGELNDLINENAAAISASGVTAESFFSILDESFKKGINDPEVLIQALTDANFRAQEGITGTTVKLEDLAGATDSLNAKYDNLPAAWEGFKRAALVALLPIGDAILGLANEVIPHLITATAWFKDELPQWIAAGKNAVQIAVDVINAALSLFQGSSTQSSGIFSSMKDIIVLAAEIIQEVAGGAIVMVSQLWDRHGNEILAIVTNVFSAIEVVITTVLNVVKGLLSAALALMRGDTEGFKQGVLDAFKALFDGAVRLFELGLDNIKQLLITGVKILGDAARDLGGGVVDGIVDSIEAGADAVIKAVFGVIDGAIEWVKNKFEIFSPSKYAGRELGEPITLGIAEGVLAVVDVLLNAVADMSEDLQEALEEAANAASEVFTDTLERGLNAAVDMAQQLVRNRENFFDNRGLLDYEAEAKRIQEEFSTSKEREDLLKRHGQLQENLAAVREEAGELEKIRKERELTTSEQQRYQEINEEIALIEKEQVQVAARLSEEVVERAQLMQAELARLNEQRAVQVAIANQAEAQLAEARLESEEIAKSDAQGAADYFKLRSEQIQQLTELNLRLAKATSETERAQIRTLIGDVQRAQVAELEQFQFGLQGDIAARQDQINGILEKLLAAAPEGEEGDLWRQIITQQLGGVAGNVNPTTQTPLLDLPEGQRVPNSGGDTYILNINTQSPYEPLLQDFGFLQAQSRQRAA